MVFIRKLFAFFVVLLGLAVLQLYTKSPGKLEFTLFDYSLYVEIYVVCFCVVSIYGVLYLLKTLLRGFFSFFCRNKINDEKKSVEYLARLIMSDDYEFSSLFVKISVVESLKALKIALFFKRNATLQKNFNKNNIEKTNIKCIDIHIIKQELQKLLSSGDMVTSIKVAMETIRAYCSYVYVVQEELLEIAQKAKTNKLKFEFEPEKFKYNLSQKYIENYYVALGFVDFEMTTNVSEKVRILLNLQKRYPQNSDIVVKLFDYIDDNDSYDENWHLNILSKTLSVKPDRRLAKYLVKMSKLDIFEITRSMMSKLSNNNIEKLWILLEIAVAKKFNVQIKELVETLLRIDRSDILYKYVVQHSELVPIFNEIEDENKV